jgi:type II secretory ATPase GspE/PulE/Tfp pilus assembly ATPase PilB-like protein
MRVLTAKGGEYTISDDLRERLAFLEDGRLFIAKTFTFDGHVRGFISRLKHNETPFTIHHTDLTVIADYYNNDTSSSVQKIEHSDMQKAAKLLFEKGVSLRSSDIHIRVSKREHTQIYFRVHNDLEFIAEHPYEYGCQLCTTIYQAMADVSDSTFEPLSRQDARISEREKIPTNLDGIRIATSPQVDGYVMVLRLLYNDTSNDFSLTNLGYSQAQVDSVEYMKKRPTGVIIIGGPTGSGKSTTLQRVLGSIIEETGGRKHIITVEDPPEYPIPGAVQTPVTNASSEEERSREYQKAIKAAMRLDPDIIMLSEVRDNPTSKLVVQAAMTGHQVWTTVHANSALAIINRMTDLGVQPELLSDPTVIAGLICQRLVKKLCPHCKKPFSEHINDFDGKDVNRFMSVLNIANVFVQGNGCDHCRGSGTSGRTVVAETIVTDNALMKFIRDGDRMGALDYVKQQHAGMTMLEHAILKITAGEVDPFLAEDVVGSLTAGVIERDHRVSSNELKNQ